MPSESPKPDRREMRLEELAIESVEPAGRLNRSSQPTWFRCGSFAVGTSRSRSPVYVIKAPALSRSPGPHSHRPANIHGRKLTPDFLIWPEFRIRWLITGAKLVVVRLGCSGFGPSLAGMVWRAGLGW